MATLGPGGGAPPAGEMGGGDGEPGGEPVRGEAIEAGCGFNGTQLQGDVGAEFQVSCPADCAAQGATWASDVYTLDSGVCRAGIHAGAIPAGGGVVEVRLERGHPAYRGSTRNGIQSYDYGAYRMSFAVLNGRSDGRRRRRRGRRSSRPGAATTARRSLARSARTWW